MKKVNLLLFVLLLIVPMFSQIRSAYAVSSGYERYKDDYCEVYVEYFPIVPFDPNYPTASEEFAIKFYVIQQSWWSGICKYWPDAFAVVVYFRDDTCGNISYTTWKRWYPTSTSQSGWTISWSLSGGYGPLTIGATISTPDSGFYTNYTKFPETNPRDGKEYMHLSDLVVDYNDNCFWGSTYTEGAGSIGIPNDQAAIHAGHHTLIAIWFGLYWKRLWAEWPPMKEYVYFRIGDDIPVDTDCWLTVEQGGTAFSVYTGGDGGGGGCPTLFVWNGTAYVDYGVINIHNPIREDVIREVPVKAEDVSISNYKAKFRLREGWPGLNRSESVIDQVKLYAVDSQGNRHLCPLISAEHSRLGNVLPQLLLSDDYRAQMLLLETVDLTFVVLWQNIQGFTFVIEGCNYYKCWD